MPQEMLVDIELGVSKMIEMLLGSLSLVVGELGMRVGMLFKCAP